MASKFVTLTEAKFPTELKKIREDIRKKHGELAKLMDSFKPLANAYVSAQAKDMVALIGKPDTSATVKTAAAEALSKLGATEDGTIPNMENLVYSFRFGTAVVAGEARKARGSKVAVI